MSTLYNDGVSPALFAALQRHHTGYKRTGYLSTTSVQDSPRYRILKERHDKEIVIPATSLIPSFVGTCVHTEIEKFPPTDGVMIEEEFTAEIGGIVFSGRPDWYNMLAEAVGDEKTTTVWTFQYHREGKLSHLMQAHINGYLIRKSGRPCTNGWVELIFLDWKMSYAIRDRSYPRRVEIIRVNQLWGDAKVEGYLEERISCHVQAEDEKDDYLPKCSDRDQWQKPNVFAVMPRGSKRAVSGSLKCHTEAAAEALIKQRGLKGAKIEHRPGEKTRCEHYCEVQKWCNQYREERANV